MFTRGEDKRAVDPAAVGVVARAAEICGKTRACPDRNTTSRGSCEGCRRQAMLDIESEHRLRQKVRRTNRRSP